MPLAAALGSVSLGAALGLLPGPKGLWLGPIRSFALTASVAVVLTHLLPEAYGALGVRALVVFAVGLLLPSLVKGLSVRLRRGQGERAGLELGYVGLLVHQVGDGLSMGALSEHDHVGHDHHDVVLALAAHTVPVAAMVVLAFGGAARKYQAGARAVGLGLSAALGVVLGHWVTAGVDQVVAWVAGLTAGLVLHVVAHDLRQSPPRGALERTLDLGAALLGAAVGALGSFGSHGHHHAEPSSGALLARLAHFAFDAGPALLLAWTLGALLSAAWSSRSDAGGAPRAAWALGAGALRARSSGARGGGALDLGAWAFAAPLSSLPFALLSLVFLGAPLTFAALVTTALLAWVSGALLGSAPVSDADGQGTREGDASRAGVAAHGARDERPAGEVALDPSRVAPNGPTPSSLTARSQRALALLVDHQGAWMVLGLALAAGLEQVMPPGALRGSPGLLVLWVGILLMLAQVSAPAAVPVAAVSIAKGLPPGAVLAVLILGAALRLRLLRELAARSGARAAGVVALWVLGAAALWALSAWLPLGGEHTRAAVTPHSHGLISRLATWVLVLLVVSRIWRQGIRAWVSELRG